MDITDTLAVNIKNDTRIDRAADRLADLVRRGGTVDHLTPEELDLLIAELVRARHMRMDAGAGYQTVPAAVTVVVQRGDDVTLAGLRTRLDRDELGSFARAFCDVTLGVVTEDQL